MPAFIFFRLSLLKAFLPEVVQKKRFLYTSNDEKFLGLGIVLPKPFPKRQNLASSKLKEFADDNFKFDENGRGFSKQVENSGKRTNCSFRATSPFPTVFFQKTCSTYM